MRKLGSFQVDTKTGGGTLEVVEKAGGGYFASFHGAAGLAHVKESGRETPQMQPVDFECHDNSYTHLIEKCRLEIEKRDSEIVGFAPITAR